MIEEWRVSCIFRRRRLRGIFFRFWKVRVKTEHHSAEIWPSCHDDCFSGAREEFVPQARERFLADVRSPIPFYPVTEKITLRAGLIDGELEATGITVQLADLRIGVTVLHHGHGGLTNYVRHFRAVPGLEVVEL